MARQTLIGPVIEAGESLSQPLDCSAGRIISITTPPEWTGANLSFVVSADGETYSDLFDPHAREIAMPVTPGVAMSLAPIYDDLITAAWLKVRSGTRDYPIVQQETRQFGITVDDESGEAGGGGTFLTVTDGTTTVSEVSSIFFDGADVVDTGEGGVSVAITGDGGGATFLPLVGGSLSGTLHFDSGVTGYSIYSESTAHSRLSGPLDLYPNYAPATDLIFAAGLDLLSTIGGSHSISDVYGISAKIVFSGYTGPIPGTVSALLVKETTGTGGTQGTPYHYGIQVEGVGNGDAGGTGIRNTGIRIGGNWAGANIEGIITNIGLSVEMPYGSAAGITRNWGILIEGDGGSGGSGTTINWAILSVSDCPSSFAGPILLPGDPTDDLHAATKQYVDAAAAGGGAFLPITGGTTSGPIGANSNDAPAPAPMDGTLGHFTAADGEIARVSIDAFNNFANLTLRRANGTNAAPTPLRSGDTIGYVTGAGYSATDYCPISRAAMEFKAAEDWTDTAQGTSIVFAVTAEGATTRQDVLRVDATGVVLKGELSLSQPLGIPSGGTGTETLAVTSGPAGLGIPGTLVMTTGDHLKPLSSADGNVGSIDGPSLILTGYDSGDPNVMFFRVRGTDAAPARITGDLVMGMQTYRGYDGTNWSYYRAAIAAKADDDWSPTNHGTYLTFTTTTRDTLDTATRLTIRSGLVVGNATGGNAGDMGSGTINLEQPPYVNGVPVTSGGPFLPLSGGELDGSLSVNGDITAAGYLSVNGSGMAVRGIGPVIAMVDTDAGVGTAVWADGAQIHFGSSNTNGTPNVLWGWWNGGGLQIYGTATVNGGSTGDPLKVLTNAGLNARTTHEVAGTRRWNTGCVAADGRYSIADETAVSERLTIDIYGTVSLANHILCQQDNYGQCGTGGSRWANVYSYAFNNASGRDLKTDISDVQQGALGKVLALRAVDFRWREGRETKRLNTGFVADEVAAVMGREWGGYDCMKDELGTHESIQPHQLLGVLWKAVQELSAKVSELEARLA